MSGPVSARLGIGGFGTGFWRKSTCAGRLFGVSSPMIIQVATLKATHGEKYPYPEPFPYWKKPYNLFAKFFDKTIHRLNENTKVIVVEGNIGVGKAEFAKSLAKEFDLKYFGPTTDADIYTNNPYGYDMRKLDPMLPEKAKAYDLRKFLTDPHPEKGTVGRLLLDWYERKYYAYADVLKHVISTGQGVVMVRSVYSDIVFVDALRRMGYVTAPFVQHYNEVRDNTICELLKPHMTIYLDAPISVCMERINQRKNPVEVGSKIISEKYLKTISDVYNERFLPKMRNSGEVVEIDWTEKASEADMDVIAEELQTYTLEPADSEDLKFGDWSRLVEDDWRNIRNFLHNRELQQRLFFLPEPWDCPEVMLPDSDTAIYQRVVQDHPAFYYQKGWAPELGHRTGFKLM